MSFNPKISFTKPSQGQSYIQSPNPYNQYNPNLPSNHQSNYYEVRQASVIQSNASPVDLSQKPATIFVGRAPPVQEYPRPQYEQIYSQNAPSKRLGPQSDPVPKDTCCTPVWWYIATLIGVAGLILSLLFGLNVIGGVSTQRVSSIAPSSAQSQTSNTTTTTYNTSPYGASTSTPTSQSNANKAYTIGTFMPASIPAQTVTTTTTVSTTHHKMPKKQDSFATVGSNFRLRHRLPVDQDQQHE